ncbi:glycosyltransferase, partial [bacterium]|nr:glycosyltransferase [bacterium]
MARANQFYFVRWYEYFIRRGHQVYVLSGDISHMNSNLAVPAGVEVYFLPEKKLKSQELSFVYNLIRLPLIMKELKKLIRKLSPDVIHAHQITPSGLWGALSNFHPFIITPIGSDVLVHARENFFYKLITRYVLKKADLITSDSFALRDAIFQFGGSPEKTHIIQNGVDFSFFNPNVDGRRLREKLGLGDSP